MAVKTKTVKNLAVYGSLRQGHSNHSLLDDQEYVATVRTYLDFEMHNLGYFPGLEESDKSSLITLELYRVDPDCWLRIEALEGYPDFYERKDITVLEEEWGVYYIKGEEYFDNRSLGAVLSGDWSML